MRGRSDFQVKRIGAIALVIAFLAMGAALNLQKFPGFRGTGYEAEFSDASGLHKGNMVQISGIRVGRVSSIELAGDHVVVHFTLNNGQEVGKDTEASSLTIRFGGAPTSFSVYAASAGVTDWPDSLDQLDEVAKRSGAPARTTVRLDPAPTTRYLLVWLTRLPAADGGYRGQIADVTVRS